MHFELAENQIKANPTHVEELRDLIALNTQNAPLSVQYRFKYQAFLRHVVLDIGFHVTKACLFIYCDKRSNNVTQ